jgi:hypothetical protein
MRHPLSLLAVLAIVATQALAQGDDSVKAKKIAQPERLFRSRETLAFTIKAPFKTLFKDRDTTDEQATPGVITVAGEDAKQIPVTLSTRGHFRLKRTTCAFPPLKVKFDKEAAKGTVFSSQGSIKLGTHCQTGTSYEQNVLVEEAIYRAYNLLTSFSHLSRLAKVTYYDTEDTTKTVTRFGFFLEDDEEMAKRNGGKLIMQMGGHLSDMEPALLDLVGMFEYMVGNTDWSVFAIHNIRLVEVPDQGGFYVPVAYDFDFSGLVNAPYAIPDERLPIRRVRQRLFRGACRKLDEIEPTLALYRAKKDSIEAIFTGIEGLEPKRLKDIQDYLGEFFDEIKESKRFNRALDYTCSQRG